MSAMSVTNIFKSDPTVVNRYLSDQLTDVERRAFEEQLQSDPDAVSELEATARLKVGLAKLREAGELDASLQPRPSSRVIVFATAAALALLIATVTLVELRTAPPLLVASAAALADRSNRPLPIATTLAIFRKRSQAYDAVIELPASRQGIELRVLPDPNIQRPPYQVSISLLRDGGSAELAGSLTGLQPGDDGFVTIFADSARLTPGDYRLVVSSDRVSSGGESFLVSVRSAPDQR